MLDAVGFIKVAEARATTIGRALVDTELDMILEEPREEPWQDVVTRALSDLWRGEAHDHHE